MADTKTIKGVLLDAEKGTAAILSLRDALAEYYAAIHCDTIDIVTRRIGDKLFSIVCDDEALLKDDPIVSAISGRRKPMLFGSLFVVSADNEDGELVGLTDDECRYVFDHFTPVTLADDEAERLRTILVLSPVDYPAYKEG